MGCIFIVRITMTMIIVYNLFNSSQLDCYRYYNIWFKVDILISFAVFLHVYIVKDLVKRGQYVGIAL